MADNRTTPQERFNLVCFAGIVLLLAGLCVALVEVPRVPTDAAGMPETPTGSWTGVVAGIVVAWVGTVVLLVPLVAAGVRIAGALGWTPSAARQQDEAPTD